MGERSVALLVCLGISGGEVLLRLEGDVPVHHAGAPQHLRRGRRVRRRLDPDPHHRQADTPQLVRHRRSPAPTLLFCDPAPSLLRQAGAWGDDGGGGRACGSAHAGGKRARGGNDNSGGCSRTTQTKQRRTMGAAARGREERMDRESASDIGLGGAEADSDGRG